MFTRPFFEPDRTAKRVFVEARGFGMVRAYDGVGRVAVERAMRPQAFANEAATLEGSV